MTELLITPNYDRKTAKFKGNAAAGERISVTIENSSDIDTATLRLRVLSHDGRMLAVFAPNVEEGLEWSPAENGISCELSLDTVEMQKAVCGMCECTLPVVLDDPDNQKLWFKSECAFQGWPKLKGGESPHDLTGFPKLIDDWVRQLGNMVVSARRVEGGVEILLWDGKGAKPNAVYVTDGEEGPKGDKGDIGIGISRIFFKQSDDAGGNVYEITLTDGSTYQFTAPRGPKGEQGDVSKAQLDAAIEDESRRATIAEDGLGKDIAAARKEFAAEDENINKRIDTLVGKDAGKTIREIADAVASALISGVVDGAPEALDTLKEIADWIRNDVSGAQAIVNQVAGLTEKVANKADTTAVADLLNSKVDKIDGKGLSTNDYTNDEQKKLAGIEAGAQKNPDLSGYATKAYVEEEVKKAGGASNQFHELVPETTEGKVTLKPVDGKANWVEGTVGVKPAKGPSVTLSLECWLEVNTMDEGGDPMTIEKYFDGLVFDEEEFIITYWGLVRGEPDTTLISLTLSKDKQVVFGDSPYMVVCTIPAGDTFFLFTFDGWIEPDYAYSDSMSFSPDRETLFSEVKVYRSEDDLVSTADSIYFEPFVAVLRSTSGSSTPMHITLPASTGPARSFSLSLTTDVEKETDATWEGADNVVEAFPGAKKLAPGTTVWDVKEVMPNTFLVDRAPATSGTPTIVGDNGTTYTLGVDTDGTLEVRR